MMEDGNDSLIRLIRLIRLGQVKDAKGQKENATPTVINVLI